MPGAIGSAHPVPGGKDARRRLFTPCRYAILGAMPTELTHREMSARGGHARAKKLSKKRRVEIATKASRAAVVARAKRARTQTS